MARSTNTCPTLVHVYGPDGQPLPARDEQGALIPSGWADCGAPFIKVTPGRPTARSCRDRGHSWTLTAGGIPQPGSGPVTDDDANPTGK